MNRGRGEVVVTGMGAGDAARRRRDSPLGRGWTRAAARSSAASIRCSLSRSAVTMRVSWVGKSAWADLAVRKRPPGVRKLPNRRWFGSACKSSHGSWYFRSDFGRAIWRS